MVDIPSKHLCWGPYKISSKKEEDIGFHYGQGWSQDEFQKVINQYQIGSGGQQSSHPITIFQN